MTTDNNPATAEAQIRALIAERVKAIHAKDVDALLSTYAADVVMFNLAPPLQTTGVDKQGAEEWLASYQSPIACELHDLRITVSDTVAFCHSLNRFSGTKTDGVQSDMWLRATVCCRKSEGKWLITHEHNSEPFDMQSFKALLDLKP